MSLFFLAFTLLFTSGCNTLFYQPDHALHYDPKSIGFDPEVVRWESKDGTKLYGWHFKSKLKKPKGTIVQFHGNAENLSSHYASLVWVTLKGYDLFTFDYRGYGQSEGSPSRDGVHMDCLSAIEKSFELHKKRNGNKFVLYGQSLGGAALLGAYTDPSSTNDVDLLVLESTFYSYQDVAFDFAQKSWVTYLISPLAYLVVSDSKSAEGKLHSIKKPVVLIHDKKDPVVSYQRGRDIYDNLDTQKWFWDLDDGYHIAAMVSSKSGYREKFLELLETL